VATLDCDGRNIFVADAHCGDGNRFVARADEKLTAFLELELAISAARRADEELTTFMELESAIRER
jgi:hypothetical protein